MFRGLDLAANSNPTTADPLPHLTIHELAAAPFLKIIYTVVSLAKEVRDKSYGKGKVEH